MATEEILQLILTEIKGINTRLSNLETRFDNLETRVDGLETEVKHNTVVTENTVQKCIEVLGEGYQMTTEKVDRLPISTMQAQINRALLTAEFANDKIDLLTDKINRTA